jgi:hypothetical protein
MLRSATNSDGCAGGVSIFPLLYYYQLSNSTALLGGGIYPSGSCDISAATANAFFPGLRLFGAFDTAMSFVVWLSSTSFASSELPASVAVASLSRRRFRWKRLRRRTYLELEMERGFGLVGCGA